MASNLALMIDTEVVKIATSFLALEALSSCLSSGLSYYNSNKWPGLGPVWIRFFPLELLAVFTSEVGIPGLESVLLHLSIFQYFFFFFQALLEVWAFFPRTECEELFKFQAFCFWLLDLKFLVLESLELLALSRLACTGRFLQ